MAEPTILVQSMVDPRFHTRQIVEGADLMQSVQRIMLEQSTADSARPRWRPRTEGAPLKKSPVAWAQTGTPYKTHV